MESLHQEIMTWFPDIEKIVKTYLDDGFQESEKENFRDIVTEVDLAVENYLIHKIKALAGSHTILAEESAQELSNPKADRLWCLDPIDGTANLSKQKEDFATMIAYFEAGIPKLAYIFDPVAGKLYYAIQDQGAYLNGKPLKLESQTLKEALVSLDSQTIPGDPLVSLITRESFGIRFLGSTAADCGRVLEGKFAASLNPTSSPWDRAPLFLFAQELGFSFHQINGRACSLQGQESYYFGCPKLYQELKYLIEKEEESCLN